MKSITIKNMSADAELKLKRTLKKNNIKYTQQETDTSQEQECETTIERVKIVDVDTRKEMEETNGLYSLIEGLDYIKGKVRLQLPCKYCYNDYKTTEFDTRSNIENGFLATMGLAFSSRSIIAKCPHCDIKNTYTDAEMPDM